MKQRVAESVPDMASVHTRNGAFEVVPVPKQDCSAVESGTFSIGQIFETARVKSEHFYRSKTYKGTSYW